MSLPKWRYVRYTDDGCAAYQCLNCYKQWEGRSEPGYYNTTKEVPEPCEGSRSFEYSRGDGQQYTSHYIDIDPPVYQPCWHFCPLCGVKWDGPIRCDVDNERMLGQRRLRIEKLIRARYEANGYRHEKEYTGLWWVIQERTTWKRDEPKDNWETKEFARVDLTRAAKMLFFLRETQVRLDAENNQDNRFSFCEARLVTSPVRPQYGYEIPAWRCS